MNKSPLPVPSVQSGTAAGAAAAAAPSGTARASQAASPRAVESARVFGAVVQFAGNPAPVAGALIEALAGDVVCGQAVSDANGAFELAPNGNGTGGACGAISGGLTFRVSGSAPVKVTRLPRDGATMVLLFVQ